MVKTMELQAVPFSSQAPRSYLTAGILAHRLCLSRLVLETLEPLPADRKCFRMINGVLVERTVKDVVPALKTNSEGLKKVLEDLVKQYNSKQTEMEKWKVCFNVLKRATSYARRRVVADGIATQKKNNIQVVQQ
jgi:chaperonin cofactor prefoldin